MSTTEWKKSGRKYPQSSGAIAQARQIQQTCPPEVSLLELSVSRLWSCGPDWIPTAVLSQGEPAKFTMPAECVSEMKKTTHILLASEPAVSAEVIMDCKRYGTLSRLVRITAYVL